MTELLCYSDLTELKAKVLACTATDDGLWVVTLNKTLFHPQGGGQPSDTGTLNGEPLIKAIHTENGIVHLLASPIEGEVLLKLDARVRRLHSRLHSAGHLIGYVGDLKGWHAYKGNHFPGQGKVSFKPDAETLANLSLPGAEALQKEVNEYVREALPFNETWEGQKRSVTWGDLPAYACGGTHVKNTAEIGPIVISKIKCKKGEICVSYHLENEKA